jgi:hypothetical protein
MILMILKILQLKHQQTRSVVSQNLVAHVEPQFHVFISTRNLVNAKNLVGEDANQTQTTLKLLKNVQLNALVVSTYTRFFFLCNHI